MRDRIRVQHAGIAALAASLQSAHQEINAELAGLEREAAALRGDWTGAASRAFDRARAEWMREVGMMAVILGEAIALAEDGAEAHRATEADVVALW